jgi:hypothetical protein
MATFFRFQDIAINSIGQALSGLEVYVCTQPLTSAPGVIPPTPLATLYAASSSNSAAITDAVYEGGYIIFTFSTTPPADVVANSFINVTGADPSSYNGVWQVIQVSGNQVTVVTPFENFVAPNPGTWVSGGTVATSALPNPVIVDANGNYFFYATNGTYTLVFFDPFDRVPTQVFPDIQVNTQGGGSVSSITVTVPAGLAVSPATITSAGTFAIVYSSDWNANFFLAGPVGGSPGTATRRAIVAADLAGISGIGTVSSVGVTLTGTSGIFSIGSSGSPVTSSGTIALTLAFANQTPNVVLAGPASGGTGPVTARALVAADMCGVVPVSFSATPAFNAGAFAFPTFTMTLTGNVTSSTVSNPTAGQTITFILTQDGTGSRTFAWPTNFKGASPVGPDANSVSVQSFVFDGTNWRATSPGMTTGS